jgi:hypothetical protein
VQGNTQQVFANFACDLPTPRSDYDNPDAYSNSKSVRGLHAAQGFDICGNDPDGDDSAPVNLTFVQRGKRVEYKYNRTGRASGEKRIQYICSSQSQDQKKVPRLAAKSLKENRSWWRS